MVNAWSERLPVIWRSEKGAGAGGRSVGTARVVDGGQGSVLGGICGG
jgi:hypothetical protein